MLVETGVYESCALRYWFVLVKAGAAAGVCALAAGYASDD